MEKFKKIISHHKKSDDGSLYENGERLSDEGSHPRDYVERDNASGTGNRSTTGEGNTSRHLDSGKNTTTGTSTTRPQNTGVSSGTTTSETYPAQVAGSGAGEGGKLSSSTGATTTSTSKHTGNNRLGREPSEGGTAGGGYLHRQNTRENLRKDAGYDTNSTSQSSGQHIGKDATTAGTIGTTAGGVHDHYKTGRPTPIFTDIGGPHKTYTANRLDPSIDTSGKVELEDAHHHSPTHGGGDKSADEFHHLKSDTPVSVSRGGSLAGSERSSKRDLGVASTTGISTTTSKGSTPDILDTTGTYATTGYNATGTHKTTSSSDKDLGIDRATSTSNAGLAEPELRKPESERATGVASTTGGSGRHVGSETAGSTGRASSAEHEYKKLEKGDSASTGPAPHTAGPHKHDWMNKLDPRVHSKLEPEQTTSSGASADKTTSGTSYRKDSDYARDSDGASGTGYEADKHRHKKTDSGVAGISPSDNKANSTLESGRSKEQSYSRDAAAVGGGGEYETDKPQRVFPLTGKPATSEDYKSSTTDLPVRTGHDNYGRDATGGAGGVGVADYGYNKHEGVGSSGADPVSGPGHEQRKHQGKEEPYVLKNSYPNESKTASDESGKPISGTTDKYGKEDLSSDFKDTSPTGAQDFLKQESRNLGTTVLNHDGLKKL